MEDRRAAEHARRAAHYGSRWVDIGWLKVPCEHCGTEHVWHFEDQGGEYPPIFFECEDVTGEDCRDDGDSDDG